MNQMDEASSIRYKNIIDIAISFSAMTRVFEQGSKQKIAGKLEYSLGLLAGIEGKDKFENMHSDFCEWFVNNVFTAEKVLKNKKIKKSRAASYGQAAKVFNIALKVYVYYCNLPDYETAAKLLPMLHSAVDTLMMEHLKKKYPEENIKAETIEGVSKADYFVLQKMVNQHIKDEFEKPIQPIHYDDIMWYRLNKRA
ncbi:MAG: hypothetical protein MUO30_03370 [Anaerolineales bacterium]|nr:hypothetical protein [Anaerolineales bacterium]